VADVLAQTGQETVVIVAHGTVITLFTAAHTGLPPLPLWHRLGLPSFVVLTVPDLRLVTMVERVGAAG
jgi:broad specificity phosphatase PhoE